MKRFPSLKPGIWGAVFGAIAISVVGFSSFGWTLGSTAERMAKERGQTAVVDVLAVKTRLAAQEYHVKQVVLAGGVAANANLRARLEQELRPLNIRLSYPPIEFCTDNAAMIAGAAFFHLCKGERHSLDLDVQPGLSLPFER